MAEFNTNGHKDHTPKRQAVEAIALRGADGSFLPQPMGVPGRNERLYKTLLDMGLFVFPVFHGERNLLISHFIVSAGSPDLQHGAIPGVGIALGGVDPPVEGL